MARIDLRSDTVTMPSPAMRRAMAEAEVGDDVFGDDPTVIALEERAAELLGKEAGLFVASGTMGNLVAQMAHLSRGQETIAGREHHLVIDEAAGHAVIVGTSIRSLEDRPDGTVDPDEIGGAFRDPNDPHEPITGLVTIENTHAHSMGQPLTPEYTRRIAAIAHDHGVPLHIDGARFWNAVVALGVRPTDLSDPADTVTFCLSKGLACPVGSVVVGRRDVIWRARRARKMVGGGMRQAGVIAAAGLIALERMVDRLADDHAHARTLAEALAAMPGITVDLASVQTNIVILRIDRGDRARSVAATEELVKGCAARKVKIHAMGPSAIRCVTHKDVDAEDIRRAVEAFRELTARW
jgi:threonine aldolase